MGSSYRQFTKQVYEAERWGFLVQVGEGRLLLEPPLQGSDGPPRPRPRVRGTAKRGAKGSARGYEQIGGAAPRGSDALESNSAVAEPKTRSISRLSSISSKGSKTTVLNVDGICCPSEVPIIDNILAKLPGIENVSTNVTARTTTVQHDPLLSAPTDLVEALNAASLGASLRRAGPERPRRRGPAPLLQLCGLLWLWAAGLQYVALLCVALGIPRIGLKAWGALRNRVLDINSLVIIATCGALAIGEYCEGAAVVFLFGLSEWIEEMATSEARTALASVLSLRPEEAVLEETGETIPVEEVRVGDRLAVRAGEKVPVDAKVVQGSSILDECALTGESVPVKKSPGSAVSGGTVNVGGGYLVVEAVAESKDSSVARMVKLIEDANNSRSRTEVLVERFAKVYTPTIVVAAALCASLPWLFLEQEAARDWFFTALVLLVVACPCALVISTPVAYVSALSCAATHNVIVRGGEHLEALGRVRTICFDKTGTLTEGRFRVRKVLGPFGAFAPGGDGELRHLAGLAASVEQKSTHPLATALVAYAKAEVAETCGDVTDFAERPGEGVEALVAGRRVQVGSQRLARRMGWLEGAAAAEAAQLEADGQTLCFLGVDGELAAVFGVADAARAEAAECVASLEPMGVEAIMLTGDRQAPAEKVAAELGVRTVKAELLPEDKVQAVQQLKDALASSAPGRRRCLGGQGFAVAMVGDGINDAAALATADVGIAMGAAGTQVAVESAQVVLMDSDLRKLAISVRLSRVTVSKIKQNIVFATVSKAIMVALTVAGYGSMWGAVIADVGAMLLVTLNASRVLSLRKIMARRTHTHNHCQDNSCCNPGKPCCTPGSRSHGQVDSHSHRHDHCHGRGHGHCCQSDRLCCHDAVGDVEQGCTSCQGHACNHDHGYKEVRGRSGTS